jgi:hypothetical protein
MLIPTGAEWHAFCLLHPEDDPQASAPHPAKAVALHLGRLGARDARKYEHLFQSHPVIVSLFIETTSGLERIEARFLNEPVQVDDSVGKHEAPTEATASPAARVSTPTSVAPANWYPDPTDQTKWRWWDGQQWTTYTAPRIKTTA